MSCTNSVQRKLTPRHNGVSVSQVPQMNPDVSLSVSSLGSVPATTLPGCCLLCLNVIVCTCTKLSNTEISGKFVLLAGNVFQWPLQKDRKDGKSFETMNKFCIFSLSSSFLNSLCSVQASEPYPSITDLFFFSPFSMPVVLVMVFAICWAPFHIDRLFFSFVVEWTEPLANVFNLIHVVSGKAFFFHLHRGWKKKVIVSGLLEICSHLFCRWLETCMEKLLAVW